MERKNLQFNVAFEGKPEKGVEVIAYAFDQQGRFLGSAPLKDGKASLSLSPEQVRRMRLFFGPPLEGKRAQTPTLELMARLRAYAPSWKYDPKATAHQLPAIPEYHWQKWLWCKCRVQGQVVRPVAHGGTTQDMPVCHARVHVCEVDPFWRIIQRLPDNLIWRLRDEFLYIIATANVPPIPPPRPGPDGFFQFDPQVIDPTPKNTARAYWMPNRGITWLNPQPEPPLPIDLLEKISGLHGGIPVPKPSPVTSLYSLPLSTQAQLSSGSLPTVKQALLENAELIRPYLCYWPWIWPGSYKCDEQAVVYSDAQGRFDTDIWYLCAGDHPDLYFWVDY
jgi:hypothetical protein